MQDEETKGMDQDKGDRAMQLAARLTTEWAILEAEQARQRAEVEMVRAEHPELGGLEVEGLEGSEPEGGGAVVIVLPVGRW